MKNLIRKAIYLGIIAGLFCFAGCQNTFEPPQEAPLFNGANGGKDTGRVAVVIGDGASSADGSVRTVAPAASDFTKVTLTFDGPVPQDSVDVSGGGEEIELHTGTWTISAAGYTGTGTAAAEGSVTVNVTNGGTTPANILLKPKTGGAAGSFSYSLTIPSALQSAGLYITTVAGGDVDTITLSPGDNSSTKNLTPGQYLVRVRLQMGTEYSGLTEALHIYSGLTSTLSKTYSAADFQVESIPLPPALIGHWDSGYDGYIIRDHGADQGADRYELTYDGDYGEGWGDFSYAGFIRYVCQYDSTSGVIILQYHEGSLPTGAWDFSGDPPDGRGARFQAVYYLDLVFQSSIEMGNANGFTSELGSNQETLTLDDAIEKFADHRDLYYTMGVAAPFYWSSPE
ncbi:MAG: hypothetical protein LBT14_08270 [Treponema sp.]|jgi:hypothetical protein|nr:hypothetical protein [Treponema sp.]